jgi:glucose/arabinose dehydrogenase
MHPGTGRIWQVEHGPKGGDELNILKAGANYGWPRVTYGTNYDGSIITNTRHLDGMEDALRTWVPSISPCGLTFSLATSSRIGKARCSRAHCRPTRCSGSRSTASATEARNG